MSHALSVRHTAADSVARVNAQSNTQVKRYWPGKAPEWAEKDHSDEDESDLEEDQQALEEEEPAATSVAAPVVLKRVADPRLARLSVKEEDEGIAKPKVISRRRAREVSDEESGESAQESSEESEDEDETVTARRQAVRERLRQRKAEEQEVLPAAELEEEEEEEEESEYETDSDEEQIGRQMLKPVFVTKKERETIAEREALEREELEAMKREKARLKERAKQTKEIVIEQYKQEEEAAKAVKQGPKELGDIDTDDEKDPEAEYEAWRSRELRRIRYDDIQRRCRRDREEREAQTEAEAERERLRTMTPEERAAWERENPKVLNNQATKKSWKFMQKYWHKGAFFQDVSDNLHASGSQPDSIFGRDFSAATGEDKLNKEILPKIMQVKNFGRRGQTKYTHLVDQDTTVRDDWYSLDGVNPRKGRKLAGTDQVFDKPKKLNT